MVVVIPSSAETQVLAERLVALSGDWRVGRVREEGAEGASGLGPALHIEVREDNSEGFPVPEALQKEGGARHVMRDVQDVDGLCHERVVLLASLETPGARLAARFLCPHGSTPVRRLTPLPPPPPLAVPQRWSSARCPWHSRWPRCCGARAAR